MKVNLKYSENQHFVAIARQFKGIHVDEPESFQGTNLGPSSVEYMLISIGGCLGSTFAYCLSKNNVKIEKLEIVIDGKLEHVGPKTRLRLVNVDAELRFIPKPGESSEKIDSCVNSFQDHCIVSNSIAQGFSINLNITRQEKDKKDKLKGLE